TAPSSCSATPACIGSTRAPRRSSRRSSRRRSWPKRRRGSANERRQVARETLAGSEVKPGEVLIGGKACGVHVAGDGTNRALGPQQLRPSRNGGLKGAAPQAGR